MNFGQAVEALKSGQRVAREGWNGKNMFLTLNRGSVDLEFVQKTGTIKVVDTGNGLSHVLIEGVQHILFERGDENTVTRMPNINMRAASGSIITGWLASQTDILAEDWVIL